MNKKELNSIRKAFVKGTTNYLRFNKLNNDIAEIAFYKIIPSPFAKINEDFYQEQFSNDVHMLSIIKSVITNQNLNTNFNTNDYCTYSHRDKSFVKAINIVINHLRNNCNYIVINNEYVRKEIECLFKLKVLAITNIPNVFIINHNFIFRGDPKIVDYFYTIFYNKDINIVNSKGKKYYININDYLDDNKINLSKIYYNDDIIKNRYDKFLINDNDNTEYRNKVADAYIKYIDVNLLNPNIDFII